MRKQTLDRVRPIRLEAADAVQEAILKGHYRPGQEISQLNLARQLGLSQASVREALQELEHRGLIVKDGRTNRITYLSEDDLAHIYQVRASLEPLACSLAAHHFNQQVGERLERYLDLMRKAAEEKNYLEHSKIDLEFHALIWKSQPNRWLERHLRMLCLPLFAHDLVQRTDSAYIDFERSLKRHRLILSALRTRDGRRAARLMERLIERFHRQDVADFRRLLEVTSGFSPRSL